MLHPGHSSEDDHDHDHDNDVRTELILIKLAGILSFLVIAYLFAFLPLSFNRCSHRLQNNVMGYGNAFAGGVFLAIGLTHLLGESSEMINEALDMNVNISFMVCMAGFLLIFLIEKVLMSEGHVHHHQGDEAYHDPSVPLLGTAPISSPSSRSSTSPLTSPSGGGGGGIIASVDTNDYNNKVDGTNNTHAKSVVFIVVLTLVLSVHGFISGVALGTGQSVTSTATLLLGILAHKWVEAIALGMSIVKVEPDRWRMLKYISIYAFSEPLGVALGMLLLLVIPQDDVLPFQAIVLAFASGTFVYVASVDILPQEFEATRGGWRKKLPKFIVCLLGAAIMCILASAFEHDHGGGDHDHDHDHDHSEHMLMY
eukprot:TRINITY_DN6828_c0_g1_i1.p1 TRINITY_DN6828_c0_g1~~TRINITY_DN6828_c0_g1_i1.p1  ORF type:complete len:368 (-),score=74.55 TRINITY_DN6828_c0_g1_i1:38-1141(-)